MKRRIKRISPLSLGKILGILFACLGLLFVPFFLLFAFIAPHLPHARSSAGPDMSHFPVLFFGAGMTLLLPIFYGILGFLQGVIGAAIYNLLARWIGGIEVEVE
jgi:glycopeptide antibiotics resistance protein